MKVYLAVFAVMALVAVCSGFTLRKKSSKFNLFKRQGGEECNPVDHTWLEGFGSQSGLSSDAQETLQAFKSLLKPCEDYVKDVFENNNHGGRYECRYENAQFMDDLQSANADAPDYIIQQICPAVVEGAIHFKYDRDFFSEWLNDAVGYIDFLECTANRLDQAFEEYKPDITGKRGIFDRLARRGMTRQNCPSDAELIESFSEDDEDSNNTRAETSQAHLQEIVHNLQELLRVIEQEYM